LPAAASSHKSTPASPFSFSSISPIQAEPSSHFPPRQTVAQGRRAGPPRGAFSRRQGEENLRQTFTPLLKVRPTRLCFKLKTARSSGPRLSGVGNAFPSRSEEHTSELQSRENLVCRLLLEKK